VCAILDFNIFGEKDCIINLVYPPVVSQNCAFNLNLKTMKTPIVYINQGVGVLASIFQREAAKRIFLVSGKLAFNGVEKLLEAYLFDKEVYYFDAYSINPKIDDIKKGIKEFNDFSPDLLLAVGGGSAIDIAKSINLLSVQTTNPEDIIQEKQTSLEKPKTPIVIMPTTAGTGSEATHFSVIYINKKKYSLSSEHMLPDYAVVDYSLVATMPEYLSACCAFDALTQAVESYWSKKSTEESREYAIDSISLILPNLIDSIHIPSEVNRKPMVLGAYLSGKAISISKTTASHAISYTFTSMYGVPHGHAVSALLGPTAIVSYDKMDNVQKENFFTILNLFECDDVGEFYAKWKQLMIDSGLTPHLSKFGVKKENFNTIFEGINIERLSGHPVPLSKIEIEVIFNKTL
jgi:alcohol dehydrogenase